MLAPVEKRNARRAAAAPNPFAVSSDGDGVHGRDEVLELGVVNDHPVEAVLVALPLDRRAGLLRDRFDELVDVVERAAELARRLRLERDRADAGGV